jgi:hypothetical protein
LPESAEKPINVKRPLPGTSEIGLETLKSPEILGFLIKITVP